MTPFSEFSPAVARGIRFVLTDIDDTLTYQGRLHPETYFALASLRDAGIKVIPVTGASAGWCDLIARMWPVDGVIGENGGLYFRWEGRKMRRGLWLSELDVERNMIRLREAAGRIIAGAAGAMTSWDQRYRETTYAIEPENITASDVTARLTEEWRKLGASCTVNSLWVLAWYGGFNKLEMSRRMMTELFARDIEAEREAFLYVGDSVNDEPMFEFFPYSAGVSTIAKFEGQLRSPPRWVTKGPGGAGFVEVANAVLEAR